MSAWLLALLACAGGVGAAGRFVADALIRAAAPTRLPAATIAINLLGSFLLGILAGAALHHDLGSGYAVLGTGLLGGFTTFSAHAVETVRLAYSGPRGYAVLNLIGTLVGAVLLAWSGYALGRVL